MKPHFNVVGSIDLENLLKKKTGKKKEEAIVDNIPEPEIISEPVKAAPTTSLPEKRRKHRNR